MEDGIADLRKLFVSIGIFILTILAAGSLQYIQRAGLDQDIAKLSSALPASWEPLQTFYNQTDDALTAQSRETERWSQTFFLITLYFNALPDSLQNDTLRATLSRYGETARNIHQYNADLQTVASAQRRNVAFRDLTKPELAAVQAIVTHRFSDSQSKTVAEASRTAEVILNLGETFKKNATPVSDCKSEEITCLLQLRSDKATRLLREMADDGNWPEAMNDYLFRNMYYDKSTGPLPPEQLSRYIRDLPDARIADAEARLAGLKSRREALMEDAGFSLPILNIHVPGHLVTLAVAIVTSILVLLTLRLYRQLRTTIAALRTAAPATPATDIGLFIQSVSLDRYGGASEGLTAFFLAAPIGLTVLFFGVNAGGDLAVLSALLAGQALGIAFILEQANDLSRSLSTSAPIGPNRR